MNPQLPAPGFTGKDWWIAVNLKWESVVGAVGYRISRAFNFERPIYRVMVKETINRDWTDKVSCRNLDLIYRIQAIDERGQLGRSLEVQVKT